MYKIKSKTALIKSLLYEFHLDKPAIDATMSKVDLKILIKAANFVRRYKPYDLVWFKAKIKEYLKYQPEPVRAPSKEEPSISAERLKEIKKMIDQRLSKHQSNDNAIKEGHP